MMPSYDTYTLRNSANFAVTVYKGIKWVPTNVLGKTHYTDQQICEMFSLTSEQKRKGITCLYEAIQLLQLSNFACEEDNISICDGDIVWALHKNGEKVVDANKGCCASVANWITYMTSDLYEEVGVISIIPDKGIGHAVNYIRNQEKWYILDANALLQEYRQYVCSETGNIDDFRKSKIITGALFQVESLESFALFFSTFIGRTKKRSFLFCKHHGEITWEGYHKHPNGDVDIILLEEQSVIISDPPNTMNVLYISDIPQILCN